MKKILFFAALTVLLSRQVFAQPLTGTKTIPGNYATLALAIADLNTKGVGTGGVTFNIAAGFTETFGTPTAGYITTLTGSAANPIIFQKSGSGANPVITAPTGIYDGTSNPLPVTMDAIIAIGGCDYVTFDGINLAEKTTNIEPTTQMEWGYAILKASGTDGSQNITIKNCTITLNKENWASKGIYSNNHTIADLTQFAVTDSAGANSNLKIFGNSVSNSCQGIYLSGYNDPVAPYGFYDLNNEIGVSGPNIITDFGGAPGVVSGIFTKYQNILKVANNTLTTSTINYGVPVIANLYGINLSTADNASFDLYNNTVSINFEAEDGYNSSLFGIYCTMGGNGTNNIANIYNNSVTNCTYPTPINGNAYYMYFYNMGVTANVYGNTVSNNLYGSNSAAATGNIRYIYIQHLSSTKGPLNVYNNTVSGNTRRQSTPGGGSTDMLNVTGSGTIMKTFNNLIDQNDVRTTYSTHCLYIYYNDEISKDIYNNTVTNITNANGSITGLQNGNGTLGRIYNNKIQNITAAADAQYASIVGINHGSGINMYYYNNMVSELNCPAAVGTLGTDWTKLSGIYIDAVQNSNLVGFYNNTIYLNATTTSSEFGSSAITALSLYGVDLRNNILINTSASAGTNGKTAGIFVRSASYSGFTSNYNNIYVGTPGGSRHIFRYGTAGTYNYATTLNDYKLLLTPQELQSVTENTPFVNVANSPYDVHVKTDVATQCEAGGFTVSSPLAITTDFDGDARFPNAGYPVNGSFTPNAPDIGADEFGGLPNDITPPAIVYAPLLNTNSLLPRTLIATITDGSGVPSTPPGNIGLPVLYWKLNSGAYQAVQGTYTGNNAYSFTFGAANAVNDVISYYIVAQDMASTPHSGAYPWVGASGFTLNPPACSVPPASPASYTIVLGIQGDFHVGVGKTYTTLKSVAADLNSKSIIGPVTFILDDNTYPSETYPIIFNANAGSSVTNTVTIKPNTGASPVFTGSVSGSGLIKFKGLDYVTIDGSNNGTSSQNLTFQNTSSSAGAHTIGITNSTSGDASTNVTLKNCIIMGQNSVMDEMTYLIVFNENGGTNGGGYNDCVITGNTLKKAKFGIDITATLDKRNYNIVISNNTIGSTDPTSYISRYGIAVAQSDNTLITGNDIMGNADGASGQFMSPVFGIVYYNNTTNIKITRNKIHDWYVLSIGSNGIKCGNGDSPTVNEISNNLIYDIKCLGLNPGTGQNNAYGIMVRDGGNMKIWNNTIYLSGPYLDGSDSYGPSSGCIGFMEWTTDQFDIRGNILRNAMTNPNSGSAGSMGKAYGMMVNAATPAAAAAKFSQLNYNDYYIDGFNGCIGQWYGTGGTALVDYQSLGKWQTFTGKDQDAITDNPVFVSNLDLHPTNPDVNNVGGPQLLPVDYAGSTRYNPTDMGAWEWSLPVTVYHTLAATDIAQYSATLNGDINTNSEYVSVSFEYGLTTAYTNTVSPVPSSVRSVNTLLPVNAAINGLAPNTTYHYRFVGDPTTSAQANVYGEDMTFTTLPGPATKTLNLTIFLEGLYAGAGVMNKAQNATGDQFPGSVADQVKVELHNATAPYAMAHTYNNVDLSTTGTAAISTIPGDITGSYYIVIKHRNSIETWSKSPVSFTGTGPFSYNFSSAAVQAYGDNMRLIGTVYAIWGADVNQDGIVDTGDMNNVENESTQFTQGYIVEDVNGDGFVDTSDMNYVENNSTAFIQVMAP